VYGLVAGVITSTGQVKFKSNGQVVASFDADAPGGPSFDCCVEFEFDGGDWFVSSWGGGTTLGPVIP
jgi:hypothetical protein